MEKCKTAPQKMESLTSSKITKLNQGNLNFSVKSYSLKTPANTRSAVSRKGIIWNNVMCISVIISKILN